MFFHNYPYTDAHELNLDFVLRTIKALREEMHDFIYKNTLKYANPIQWSIINQYESRTIVIDPNTGIAYISIRPVPSGIDIYNNEYWDPVFDLSHLFNSFSDDITFNNEYVNIVSTHSYNIDDWLIWKNRLYVVTSGISVGDVLVPGTNLQLTSIEQLYNTIKSRLINVENDVTVLKTHAPVYKTLSALQIADLAVGSVAVTIENGTNVNWIIKNAAGTDDYAISLNNGNYACAQHEETHVKGLITDMYADNSAIVNSLINKKYPIFFDDGLYFLNLTIPANTFCNIRGCGIASTIEPATNAPIITIIDGLYTNIKDIKLQNNIHFTTYTNAVGIKISNASKCVFDNIVIEGCHGAVYSRGGCLWNTFKNVRAYGTVGLAFRFEAISAGDQINNNNFIACEVTMCTGYGWYFNDTNRLSYGNNMIGCTCESTGTTVGSFSGDHTTIAIVFDGACVNMNGCYIEACDNQCVIRATFRCIIKDCSFLGITCPIFELIGSYDQAVFECNNGHNVTGALYSSGSGTLTGTANNVSLPTV